MGAGIDLASAGCSDAELTCPRSVSEYLSVLPHGPLVFAGPLPFGFGPALGAHYPPSTHSGAVRAAPNLQKIVRQAYQLPLG